MSRRSSRAERVPCEVPCEGGIWITEGMLKEKFPDLYEQADFKKRVWKDVLYRENTHDTTSKKNRSTADLYYNAYFFSITPDGTGSPQPRL